MTPLAALVVEEINVLRISSSVMPLAASLAGSTWTRIDGVRSPNTETCATPDTCEICFAMKTLAYSSTVISGKVSECTESKRTGTSAGLTFLYAGGGASPRGSVLAATVIAACTSCGAESILRSRSNWMTMVEAPSELCDVIWVMPAIWPNCCSSGAATEVAMVSALAPDQVVVTWMVGKSTCGSGATGRNGNETMPTNAIAAIMSVVATGRRMNGSEIFTTHSPASPRSGAR